MKILVAEHTRFSGRDKSAQAITDAVSASCVPSCQLCTPHVDIQLRLDAVHIAAPPTSSAADCQRAHSFVTGIEKQEHIT